MELGELLRASGVAAELRGDASVEIRDLAYDSRRVGAGRCSSASRASGQTVTISRPARSRRAPSALVVERALDLDVPQAQVEDARAAMAPIAATFNGDPTSELGVVGITGTNGKTTTAFLVRHLLESAGHRCGLLGTVQQVVGGEVEEVERTTPEAIDLQRTFDRMLESGDEYCAMEVSSHALVLHRADAIHFAVKVFTNLSQDHLDFHADMEDYFERQAAALLRRGRRADHRAGGRDLGDQLDDPYGRRLAEDLDCGAGGECVSYSAAGGAADLSARDVAFDACGSRFVCLTPEGELEVRIPLPGDFNVANALAALAVAHALGLDLARAPRRSPRRSRCPAASSRSTRGSRSRWSSTTRTRPDSLENVLAAARRVTAGRLISRLRRRRGPRPREAAADGQGGGGALRRGRGHLRQPPLGGPRRDHRADRGRDRRRARRREVVVEQDRRAAIALALGRAGEGDMVVIAGKGHEQGQEFEDGRKVPFDDRDVARDELRKLKAAAG